MSKTKTKGIELLAIVLVSMTLAHQFGAIQSQCPSEFGAEDNNDNKERLENVGPRQTPNERQQTGLRTMLSNMVRNNVPAFYDMVKDGSNMGRNVLSGLVQVERGDVGTRSGPQSSRPLSVKVLGVPIYERGQRARNPPNPTPGDVSRADNKPKVDNDNNNNNNNQPELDELPIEP